MYPETAGRTLEDIDRFFAGHTPLLVIHDKEATKEGRASRFVEHEKKEIRRNSSIVPTDVQAADAAYRRSELEREKLEDSGVAHHETI